MELKFNEDGQKMCVLNLVVAYPPSPLFLPPPLCSSTPPPSPPISPSTFPPHLEVVGQLLSSSIARVHGDEDGTRGIKGYLCALKDEALESLVHSHLDTVDLLGNH